MPLLSTASQNSTHKIKWHPCKYIQYQQITGNCYCSQRWKDTEQYENTAIISCTLSSLWTGTCSSSFFLVSLNPNYSLGLVLIQQNAHQETVICQFLSKTPMCYIYITKQMLLASGLPFRNNSAEKKVKREGTKKSCCNLWRAGALELAKQNKDVFPLLGYGEGLDTGFFTQRTSNKQSKISFFLSEGFKDSIKIQTFPQQSPLNVISSETLSWFQSAHKSKGC